jgi:hypothetical protein
VAGEDHPNPNPTPEQVLQSLQAELQVAQQKRDKFAVTFAANQRVMQASLQAVEIIHQLAILQTKIQSM